jgi:hypothetical protein
LFVPVLICASMIVSTSPTVGARAAAIAPPCISATEACTEWVTLGSGPGRSMFYRMYTTDSVFPVVFPKS